MVVCSACHVHFKRTETVCPHCDAPVARGASPLLAGFALGMALSGCNADDDAPENDDVSDFGDAAAYGVPATESDDLGDDGVGTDSSGTSGGTAADSTGASSGSESSDTADESAGSSSSGAADSGSDTAGSSGDSTGGTTGGSTTGGTTGG
ncbi:MAG: hypothetical protein AAF721_05655 [Myxococcota bacterium]